MKNQTTPLTTLFRQDGNFLVETAAMCITAAALPFSVTFIQGGVLLLLAAGLFRYHRQGRLSAIGGELAANPLLIPWLVYMGAAVLSTAFGVAPGHSLGGLNSDLFRAGAFFIFFLFLRPRTRDAALDVYLFAVTVGALWGIGQSLNGLAHGVNMRAHASDYPVRYGEIMAIGLALALSKVSEDSALSARARKLLYGAILLITSALALSETRGAYLGAALVFATVFIASRAGRRIVATLVISAAVLGLALSLLNPVLRYKLESIFMGAHSVVTDTAAPDQSIGTRMILWHTGFKIIKDHPVFGVGINNVKKVFPAYCPPPFPEGHAWGSLHNLYINHAAERGLVGLAALLFLFAAMLVTALRRYRAAPGHLTLWALAIMPAWLMMNVTEITFQHVHTSYAVLLALALSLTAGAQEPGA